MNKRIFITGGASGLGKSIAYKYAKEGYKVCIGDITDEVGNALVIDLKEQYDAEVLYLNCDVRLESSIQKVADRLLVEWGGVDVVVNNAGVAASAPIEDGPMDDWEWIMDINLLGVARSCKVFTPIFKKQSSGYFINIASMAGIVYLPMMASYNASKAAVVALSETLKLELQDDNIGVTVVCPSFFKTNIGNAMRSSDERKRVLNKLANKSPISAEEVADMIFDGHRKSEFHVITHKKGRTAFWMKKILPIEMFHKQLYKQISKFKKVKKEES